MFVNCPVTDMNHRCGLSCADPGFNRAFLESSILSCVPPYFMRTSTQKTGGERQLHWSEDFPMEDFVLFVQQKRAQYIQNPNYRNRGDYDASVLQVVNRYLHITYAPYRYGTTAQTVMFMPFYNTVFSI